MTLHTDDVAKYINILSQSLFFCALFKMGCHGKETVHTDIKKILMWMTVHRQLFKISQILRSLTYHRVQLYNNFRETGLKGHVKRIWCLPLTASRDRPHMECIYL